MTDLLTRDGAISTAAICEAHAIRPVATVPISLPEVLVWARENNVELSPRRDPLAAVNAYRTREGLPEFEITASTPERQKPRPTPKICTLPPLAETEGEMMALVRGFVGTKSGTLTPAMAAVLLKLNTGNRQMVRGDVLRFRNILERGQWKLTGEPLIVASDGRLNDGQHRLAAIVETGISAELDVRFGAKREAFMMTNTGATRTAGQALYILGERNTGAKAAIGRLTYLYDNNRISSGGSSLRVEIAQVVETVRLDPNIDRAAHFVRGVGSGFSGTRTTPFGFVMVIAARKATFERALSFGVAVKDGRGVDDDPTRVLHLKLRDLKRRTLPFELAAVIVRAWNAWISKRPISRLPMLDTDSTPAGFPRIVGPGEP